MGRGHWPVYPRHQRRQGDLPPLPFFLVLLMIRLEHRRYTNIPVVLL
jgi:hypothetical protein